MAAVKAVADARTETAGPAFALLRRRLGNRDRNQTVHAGGRVMLKPPGQAAVDHHLHPFDGQAGFGDVRRQNDLSFFRRENRPLLLFKGEVSVKRMNGDAARSSFQSARKRFAQARISPPPGRKTRMSPEVSRRAVRTAPAILPEEAYPARPAVALFHRKGSPAEEITGAPSSRDGHRPAVQGRRHDQNLEVFPQGAADVETERQGEVGLEAPLVELVEDDHGHAFQSGIRRMRRVRIPSVTTSIRVFSETRLSNRME